MSTKYDNFILLVERLRKADIVKLSQLDSLDARQEDIRTSYIHSDNMDLDVLYSGEHCIDDPDNFTPEDYQDTMDEVALNFKSKVLCYGQDDCFDIMTHKMASISFDGSAFYYQKSPDYVIDKIEFFTLSAL